MTARKPASIDSLELTQKELATLLGVVSRTVFNLRADGMPSISRGGKVLYPAPACTQWYIARVKAEAKRAAGESRGDARAREDIARADKTEAEAALAQMKLEQQREEWVRTDEAVSWLDKHLVAVRDVLMAMPHRYAGRWPGDMSRNMVTLRDIVQDLFKDLRETGKRLAEAGASAEGESGATSDTEVDDEHQPEEVAP